MGFSTNARGEIIHHFCGFFMVEDLVEFSIILVDFSTIFMDMLVELSTKYCWWNHPTLQQWWKYFHPRVLF